MELESSCDPPDPEGDSSLPASNLASHSDLWVDSVYDLGKFDPVRSTGSLDVGVAVEEDGWPPPKMEDRGFPAEEEEGVALPPPFSRIINSTKSFFSEM